MSHTDDYPMLTFFTNGKRVFIRTPFDKAFVGAKAANAQLVYEGRGIYSLYRTHQLAAAARALTRHFGVDVVADAQRFIAAHPNLCNDRWSVALLDFRAENAPRAA